MSGLRAPRPRTNRRYPRLTVRVDVLLETPGGPRAAVATTLGAGGLFVATDDPLPPRTPVAVHFHLPGETERLRFEAHVVWRAPADPGTASPGMGLEFDDTDARAQHAARLEAWAIRRESELAVAGGGP